MLKPVSSGKKRRMHSLIGENSVSQLTERTFEYRAVAESLDLVAATSTWSSARGLVEGTSAEEVGWAAKRTAAKMVLQPLGLDLSAGNRLFRLVVSGCFPETYEFVTRLRSL